MAADWLLAKYPRGSKAKCVQELQRPVLAAIQALQRAGLLQEQARGGGAGGKLSITILGEQALAENNARQYL